MVLRRLQYGSCAFEICVLKFQKRNIERKLIIRSPLLLWLFNSKISIVNLEKAAAQACTGQILPPLLPPFDDHGLELNPHPKQCTSPGILLNLDLIKSWALFGSKNQTPPGRHIVWEGVPDLELPWETSAHGSVLPLNRHDPWCGGEKRLSVKLSHNQNRFWKILANLEQAPMLNLWGRECLCPNPTNSQTL